MAINNGNMPNTTQDNNGQTINSTPSVEKTACVNNDKEASKELEKLKEEKDRYFNDWQRARADLANYKKDEQKRLEEVIKFANERLIKELINILDSFDLALASWESQTNTSLTEEKYLKGIWLIKNQLDDLLAREGVNEIVVKIGQLPDLNYQEVVSEIESSDYPPGTVANVFQKGYLYQGKIIRPARVAVAKTKK